VDFGGKAAAAAGGASYNTAAQLRPGVYSDSLLGGETKFYKVPVDYGQRLSFAAKVTADGGTQGSIGRSLRLALFSPLRQETELASNNDKFILGNSLVHTFIEVGDSLDASMAVPVRFNNRNSDDAGIEQIAYPGGYYLAASLEDGSTADAGTELSFDLALEVSGDAENGPGPAPGVAAAAPSAGPAVGSSAAPSATAGTAGTEDRPTAAGSSPLWWGVGAAGLLAVAGAVFAAFRRSAKQRNTN
jgi:Ca-activated chloride channel family protein